MFIKIFGCDELVNATTVKRINIQAYRGYTRKEDEFQVVMVMKDGYTPPREIGPIRKTRKEAKKDFEKIMSRLGQYTMVAVMEDLFKNDQRKGIKNGKSKS
jgi:hypothetical protein